MEDIPVFHAPTILHILCYFAGMGVFLSTVFWLYRKAYGYENIYSLRGIVGVWLLRVIAAGAFFSLGFMAFGYGRAEHIFSELSVLCLIFALYLLSTKERPFDWINMIIKSLPRDLLKMFGVIVFCVFAWVVSLAFGWGVFMSIQFIGAPLWFPIFIIGIIWNAPVLILYLKAQKEGRLEDLKFHQILWPILLAYIFLMFPEITESIANNPKIHEMMNASPPLIRV